MGIKEQRRAALAAFKSRKNDYGGSALDTYDPNAANDVQDFLENETEEDYRARVEANRQKEDFVVDDGTFLLAIIFSVIWVGF